VRVGVAVEEGSRVWGAVLRDRVGNVVFNDGFSPEWTFATALREIIILP